MEPYNSAPVFVDVERSPERYLIIRDTSLPDYQNAETMVTPESQAFASRVMQSLPRTTSQIEITQMSSQIQIQPSASNESIPTTSQIEGPTKPGMQRTALAGEPCPAPGPRIRCPECRRYTADTEEKILRHIKKIHKGENPFECYMCDYNTYNKSLFEEHVRIHQGIKPFKCSHCDYKSASKKNLKKHALIHRPNNPLKCKQCEFIARHPRALKRHEEVHTGANWLKFDSCKFQFQDLAAFEKHERTHKLKCKECEFKSCSRASLKRHMVNEHGLVDGNVNKRWCFTCQICRWTSSTMAKILLHLIHHPKQEVDESVIDVSILRKHGIMT